MSPAAAFHAQLSSIMEVLANTAVAEICDLVDNGYSVLQLEISRSRKENEVLRRKLRLMELRAARTAALRAAVTGGGGGGGGALLCASGRARALLLGHHPGNDARRSRTPGGEVVLPRQTPQDPPQHEDPRPPSDSVTEPPQPAAAEAPSLSTALIKVEVVDESWSQSEHNKQAADTEAPPPVTKQETPDEGDDSSRSWASGEVSSTSTFVQKPVTPGQRSDGGGYECVMYEPQLQHGPHTTQNPLGEDPSCSYSVNTGVLSVSADSGDGGFPFSVTEVSLSGAEHQQPAGLTDSQQRAPPAADQPQPPVREEATGTQSAFIRRDRWRHQGGVNRASSHSTEEGRGKFVCSFCGKTLACLKNLKTHMRVHTGEKPFSCSLCGKCFSDSSNLKRHQNVHTGEKRYGCVHCGKRFAQSGSLKVHMTVHTDCKQFRCVYCGKTFISGTHLRRHITVHAGEKPLTPTVQ